MSNKKIKFSEAVSHAFKRHKLYNGFQFLLIVGILVVAYYCIYLWVDNNNLPEIDITQNKIHTLSDSSKSVMSQIDKEIYIYVYGYDEDDSIFELLRQYNKTNSLINYKRITEETDLDIITNHNLSEGYTAVIISCGEYEKILDASEFQKLDYTTYQYVDITEQVLTNSILSLVEDNKPKIYFLAGHQEYTDNELTTIKYFLTNESFEYETLNGPTYVLSETMFVPS